MRRRRTSHAPAGADSRSRVLSDSNGSRAANGEQAEGGQEEPLDQRSRPPVHRETGDAHRGRNGLSRHDDIH
jgi:hypothetical protein